MPETTTTSEFVLRRLGESFTFFGHELHPIVWVILLIAVLVFGIGYVILMYRKDRQSIPLGFAIFLAILRICVYLLLAAAFMLPAKQNWERAEKRSRVVVLLDVSPSITKVSDEIPSASKPVDKLETRLDKILTFLSD